MKNTLLLFAFLFVNTAIFAQKLFTKNGHVSFTSKAPLEQIDADNHSANIVVDIAASKVQVAVLIKSFKFDKALMEEHFNENYMESSKYPKAVFSGSISGIGADQWKHDGSYEITAMGDLTMHGVVKPVKAKGQVKIAGGIASVSADFTVQLSDYQISIPSVVKEQISNTVKISIAGQLQALAK